MIKSGRELLKHKLKGHWSRRITDEHRLVYTVGGRDGKTNNNTNYPSTKFSLL